MQAGFQKSLMTEVAAFRGDALAFAEDWRLNGPMVPGLDPLDAIGRLNKFQQLFEARGSVQQACLLENPEDFDVLPQ